MLWDITGQVKRIPDLKIKNKVNLIYQDKKIGFETNDGTKYKILMKDGFSLKTVSHYSYPPEFRIIADSKYL